MIYFSYAAYMVPQSIRQDQTIMILYEVVKMIGMDVQGPIFAYIRQA